MTVILKSVNLGLNIIEKIMQKFILLLGHQGSGKSTFSTEKIAQFQREYPQTIIHHIENDKI